MDQVELNPTVLHVVPSVNSLTGGPSESVTQLASENVGHRILSQDNQWRGEIAHEGKWAGITAKGYPSLRKLRGFDFPFSVTKNFPEFASDIIHSHGLWMAHSIIADGLRAKGNGLHVVSPRGMLEAYSLKRSALQKRVVWKCFQQRVLSNANAFHATSETEADNIRRLGFPQPIGIIPNGIVLSGNTASKKRHEGTFRLFFMSRIDKKKGLLELIESLADQTEDLPDWSLSIAGKGDDDYEQLCRDKAQQVGLKDRISWHGHVSGEAKEALFQKADVFVLPTYSENFGNVVLEALDHQVPVMTTTGTPWEVLEQENCGWYIEPGLGSLRQAMPRVLATSREELREMGVRGKEVAKDYSWESVRSKFLQFYRWICGHGEVPSFVRI